MNSCVRCQHLNLCRTSKTYDVVLELELDELLHGNVFVDLVSIEAGLQDLEIVDVFVFLVGVKFDLCQVDVSIDRVKDLAVERALSTRDR